MKLAEGWAIWESSCLRAPGFPTSLVAPLASVAAVTAVEALGRSLDDVETRRRDAVTAVRALPVSKAVNKIARALERGECPELPEGFEPIPALAALNIAIAAGAAVRQAAETELALANIEVARALLAAVADDRFREALLWQNRGAVTGSVAALQRRPVDATDSKTREHRRLVASYVQRYAVKNDTIGFFGPVGWAQITSATEPIAVTPGETLLAARRTFFEWWAVDTLARQLAADPELEPYLVPRRHPLVRIADGLLYRRGGNSVAVPEMFSRALAAMDGTRTIAEIAALLPDLDVPGLVEAMAEKGVCTRTFELPSATFTPELDLRRLLEAAQGPARDRGLALLDQLESGKAAISAAAGDPAALEQALTSLDAVFLELTATSPTRKGGETYAGRTLVFEDTRRDLDATLGAPIIAALGPALGLILDSARWFTYEIARRYRVALVALFDELRGDAETVEYVRLLDQLPTLFPGPGASHGIAYDVSVELQQRWRRVLALSDASVRSVERTSEEVRAAVRETFAAPGPGWPSARHHAPDLMIAAESVAAIARGDYHFVLGELHVGFNTVTLPCLAKEHPDPAVLVAAREADLPAPGIAQVWSRARNRADFFSLSQHDLDVEVGETRSARPRSQVMVVSDLEVSRHAEGRLVVTDRASGRVFDLIQAIEQHLIAESFPRFRLIDRQAHMPRVTIDKLVIQRETWTFAASDVPFAQVEQETERFLGAQRFARTHGLPRWIYAKTDAEAKPFYVDLASPLLVEILARQIKRSQRVTLSEMSPALDECWLPDARGERYTSELRLCVTDEASWQA